MNTQGNKPTMKVAKILDQYTVAINQGVNDGITEGDLLCIANDVTDPETGDIIGQYPNIPLRVTEAYPRFCVAQTYRLVNRDSNEATIVVNVGDEVHPRIRP